MAELMGIYLKVSVYNIVLVHIPDTLESLCEKSEGFGLTEGCFGVLVVEEIAVFSVVHDHVDGVILKEGVPEFY
jgi:hypothetical protein